MKIFRVPFVILPPKQCKSRRKEFAPPIPRPFDFGFTKRRPLLPMPAVAMFLNKRSREVMELIEDGELRWAFDIRSAKAGRREVRVLRQSLFEYAGLFSREPEKPETEKDEFLRIMDLILAKGTVLSPVAFNRVPAAMCTPASRSFHLNLRLPVSSVASLRKKVYPPESVLCGTEVARCFSCMSQHVTNLIKENSLRTVEMRRGVKASPLVLRASVVEFLQKRRMS